ncbi:MAG: acylphosphatase [Elusimicrobiota bacterium]
MIERVELKISGMVQGVCYRYFAIDKAKPLGIKGYVRNSSDGAVYIVAEADTKVLKDFIKILKKGPYPARVDNVQENWQSALNEFSSFEIRY